MAVKNSESDDTSRLPELFEVIASLRNAEEAETFLVDLCTPMELRAMAERWRAVQLVDKEVPYRRICEMTGVSTATVTRVARSLHEGQGYQNMIARMKRKKS